MASKCRGMIPGQADCTFRMAQQHTAVVKSIGWPFSGSARSCTPTQTRPVLQMRPATGPPYSCPCGAGFGTLARLQWHVNGVHPPGSKHSPSLGLLPRMGGSYIVHDPESRAVLLCDLARYPVSGGINLQAEPSKKRNIYCHSGCGPIWVFLVDLGANTANFRGGGWCLFFGRQKKRIHKKKFRL